VFVGSTPSTLQLPAGAHRVSIRHGNLSWDRSVQLNAGSAVTMNAVLSAPAPEQLAPRRALNARK
jgi:hypothetical protein